MNKDFQNFQLYNDYIVQETQNPKLELEEFLKIWKSSFLGLNENFLQQLDSNMKNTTSNKEAQVSDESEESWIENEEDFQFINNPNEIFEKNQSSVQK